MKKNEFFALINCFAYFCFYEIRVGGMSLKMRYYYIVGIWSFCFVLPVMMGCMREEKKSSKDSFEMLYQQMEQASVESPEQVFQMVDSALPSLKDSMMYYRLLFLKVRGYFCLLSLILHLICLTRLLLFVTGQRKIKMFISCMH